MCQSNWDEWRGRRKNGIFIILTLDIYLSRNIVLVVSGNKQKNTFFNEIQITSVMASLHESPRISFYLWKTISEMRFKKEREFFQFVIFKFL